MVLQRATRSVVPEVLTKGKSLSDPKMLAAMPSFEDFVGDLPQTGFSHNFLDRAG